TGLEQLRDIVVAPRRLFESYARHCLRLREIGAAQPHVHIQCGHRDEVYQSRSLRSPRSPRSHEETREEKYKTGIRSNLYFPSRISRGVGRIAANEVDASVCVLCV